MSTHNIHFYGKLTKIILQFSSNTLLICSSVTMLSNKLEHGKTTKLCLCLARTQFSLYSLAILCCVDKNLGSSATGIMALLFTECDVARNSHVLQWNFSIPHRTSYSMNSQATVQHPARTHQTAAVFTRHIWAADDKTNKMTSPPSEDSD